MKKPTTKIHLRGVTLVAGEGYELLQEEADTVTVLQQQDNRYAIHKGLYSYHFKDTITGEAIPLTDVLRILNKHGVKK